MAITKRLSYMFLQDSAVTVTRTDHQDSEHGLVNDGFVHEP